MPWIIMRTTSGERFMCQTEANLAESVTKRKIIEITNIYSLVTITISQGGMPSRITALEYPDLQNGKPLDRMSVLPAAWYKIDNEQAEKEIEDLRDSVQKAKEFREQMESRIAQAQLAAMPGPPGALGSIVKPPGSR